MKWRNVDLAFALLRIVAGLQLFAFHGWNKLTAAYGHFAHGNNWMFAQGVGKLGFPFPVFFASLSTFAEGILSLFLVLGLLTRYAAAFIVINMAVAIYRHITSEWRFELAALYGFIALVFVLIPPGRFSIDAGRGHAVNIP
jgi:putative oxidoreductase